MPEALTVSKSFHFSTGEHGKRKMVSGPEPVRDTPQGRVPRVSRLMALAIKFDDLLAKGAVRDQTELAELGHVTRARVTQIMNLLHLAPDIQEDLLHLPRVTAGDDPFAERNLRHIVKVSNWGEQRRLWREINEKNQCSFHIMQADVARPDVL
jgi:hypothetical protein